MHVCVCPTKSERRDGNFFATRKNQGMDAEKKGLAYSLIGNLPKYSILEIKNDILKNCKQEVQYANQAGLYVRYEFVK